MIRLASIFRFFTHNSQVLEAVEHGEPMHLANEDWMTMPWESRPKTRFDKLIDICMLSPAIVLKANGMKNVPGCHLLDWMVSLVSDIAALIKQFDSYHEEFFESCDGSPAFWEGCESQGGYVEGEGIRRTSALIFEPTLSFADLDTASILFMNCKLDSYDVLIWHTPLTLTLSRELTTQPVARNRRPLQPSAPFKRHGRILQRHSTSPRPRHLTYTRGGASKMVRHGTESLWECCLLHYSVCPRERPTAHIHCSKHAYRVYEE